MTSFAVLNSVQKESLVVRSGSLAPQWYAVYTRAQHEKSVVQHLDQRGIESFLPLYETVRRWKDRRMRLHLALFPGYVFVRIALSERLAVLRVPSVVRLVGFNGRPAPVPNDEVESLRRALLEGLHAEPYPYMREGQRVRITAGALAGREGLLVRRKSNLRVVLSAELIQRSILVDIDVSSVVPIHRCSDILLADSWNSRQHASG
jgi:transcription antitermination factor NusG